MGALSRALSKFCYKHPRFGIPQLMKYIAIANVVVYLLDMLTNGIASALLAFFPSLIQQGQVWRLITFVIVPEIHSTNLYGMLTFAISTFFYYWIGSSLERQWGTAQFNIYYGTGVLMNIVVGMATGSMVSMYYINMSLFFAFATMFPDMQVYLYGILPLKVKWLAWFDAALFAYAIITSVMAGNLIRATFPIIAILNYVIFFWGALTGSMNRTRQHVQRQRSPQVVNFKKAQKEIRERKGYLHKCEVCGITDETNPEMEFRYCSKCNGYHCYCMNHINNHEHVQ